MGNNCEHKAPLNYNQIFFYKNLNSNSGINEEKEITQKVKLTFSLKNINDSSPKSINLILEDPEKKNSHSVGNTETKTKDDSNSINFVQFFLVEYFFEKQQPLIIKILNNNSIQELIETNIGNIMGCRGQKLKKVLSDNSILEISGLNLENKNMKCTFEISLNGNFNNMSISYLVKYLGTQNIPKNDPIYRSEIIKNSNNFNFKNITIPTMFLCPDGNYDNNIISIEIFDNISKTKLIDQTGPLNTFFLKNINLTFTKGTALLKIKNEKQYTFLDYLRGGIQINLTIGIDFTSSNKNYNLPESLHYIGSENMNSYEIAIKYCGEIVAYYDYDQLFPVYGYGGKLPNENVVNHCFPLNGNINQPEINSINNILLTYRQVLPMITLYGPTFFAPLINNLNENVKNQIQQGNYNNYHILMILTDGVINDMNETVNAVVEASYLPISIIIIGIGYADFSNMNTLDADDEILIDSNGRKADRDLVQFVPFNKFMNDGRRLAAEVLEEIPRQIVEYYQHQKMPPGDPIIDIV
jgi:hypothetical protein